MITSKQPVNSFKSYSDGAKSRDFDKIIKGSRVRKTAFDIMERIIKHFNEVQNTLKKKKKLQEGDRLKAPQLPSIPHKMFTITVTI